MRRHILSAALLLLTLGAYGAGFAQARRPIALDDMFRIQRVTEPALSPDGKWILYTLTIPDWDANKMRSDLWIANVDSGNARRLTADPGNEKGAAWSPDGKTIAFESNRSGSNQIWLINPDGTGERQFSATSTESTMPVWSPDGKSIAYVSDVFPEYSSLPFAASDTLNRNRQFALDNGKVKAKIFTQLLYRHWDSWVDGKRRHIFLQPFAGGEPKDLTPGENDAVPTSSTFADGIDFAFSPDSKEIAYAAPPVPTRDQAWSTDHNLFTVAVDSGSPRQITTNTGADGSPRYSPDGKFIAYRAQMVSGFEADRWEVLLYDRTTGTRRSLTEPLDRSAHDITWSPDSKRIFFDAEELGSKPIFVVSTAGYDAARVFATGTNMNLRVSPDGQWLYFLHLRAVRSAEVGRVGVDGKNFSLITHVNDALYNELDIPAPQAIWFDGDGGTKIHAWLFKPAGFDSTKKYPLVYLVHGGPQNAWLDSWSFRWCPALWAAQGYIIMAPNPRGSTGFGQQFTNEISRDWGGKVFRDLMKGVDYADSLQYVDRANKAAAGASYGGYMMNWFQAKAGGRFKTLVTHDGTYNFESMYGTTEEVWFDEWDHGKPWENPEEFNKFSPHKYAQNFKTPNLIIHSENDFRVPIGEGMQLFTALQRQGIPSKFLYFPDETHFVSKPQNSALWHNTVFEWLRSYIGPVR
jgi:dipeptidyl aminopeptidase/acylaminoacyl peptidase